MLPSVSSSRKILCNSFLISASEFEINLFFPFNDKHRWCLIRLQLFENSNQCFYVIYIFFLSLSLSTYLSTLKSKCSTQNVAVVRSC